MKQDYHLQKVAYIGLRNTDGSYMRNVPLYVKVSEVNANGLSAMQDELIGRISSVMMKSYENRISQYMANLKKGEQNNVSSDTSLPFESGEQATQS